MSGPVAFGIDDMICMEVNEAGPTIRYQWNREEKKDFARRILNPGVFEWDRIRKKADESGAVIYRQSETPDVYKEEAESVMIVMSTAAKGLKASVIFSNRHTEAGRRRKMHCAEFLTRFLTDCAR